MRTRLAYFAAQALADIPAISRPSVSAPAPAFSKALFRAGFGEGRNIAEEAVLNAALKEAGADPGVAFPASRGEDVKGRLRAEIEYAKSIGIFGAPTFVTEDGELFWGDDRLEEALDWARHGR